LDGLLPDLSIDLEFNMAARENNVFSLAEIKNHQANLIVTLQE
jgi:hypothetical protein